MGRGEVHVVYYVGYRNKFKIKLLQGGLTAKVKHRQAACCCFFQLEFYMKDSNRLQVANPINFKFSTVREQTNDNYRYHSILWCWFVFSLVFEGLLIKRKNLNSPTIMFCRKSIISTICARTEVTEAFKTRETVNNLNVMWSVFLKSEVGGRSFY